MNIKESIQRTAMNAAVEGVFELIEKNPEKNVDRIFQAVEKLTKDEHQLEQIKNVESYYKDMPATHELVQNILTQTDKKCLKTFFKNFFVNANWIAGPKRAKYMEQEDTKIPFVLLISPSMQCNLRCKGCYAAEMLDQPKMPIEEVERLVKEAHDLGMHWIIVLGGEPFFYKEMMNIYRKYNDMMFTPFTNGSLIDEKLAREIRECGNVVPMMSIEGDQEATEARRGKGVYEKVMHGMDCLKKEGVLFGVSTCVTRYNIDSVLSDEFVDMLIDKGVKMNWYFLFMPVGDTKPAFDMMLTPEQRAYLGARTKEIRSTKPFFTIDFFNDAPYVGGCIAGKYYMHVNVHEDCEPCIFAHFSACNLKDGKHLIDAFRTPFFKELRARQPYNKNMLRPCMMIDNPDVCREVCDKTGAKATDPGAEAMLHDEEFNKKLHEIADEWAPLADRDWENVFNGKGNDEFSRG